MVDVPVHRLGRTATVPELGHVLNWLLLLGRMQQRVIGHGRHG
jgi:hypothetical protein